MDGGRPEDRVVELYPATHPRLDHGYAVTSHSSQGQTADRVLIHVDTELGGQRSAQQPHRLRCRFARRAGSAPLHQRPREAARSIRAQRIPRERPYTGDEAGASHHAATAGDCAGHRTRLRHGIMASKPMNRPSRIVPCVQDMHRNREFACTIPTQPILGKLSTMKPIRCGNHITRSG